MSPLCMDVGCHMQLWDPQELGGGEPRCAGSDPMLGKAKQDDARLHRGGRVGGTYLRGFSIKKGPEMITKQRRRDQRLPALT